MTEINTFAVAIYNRNMKQLLFGILSLLIIAACESDKPQEKSLQEIRTEDLGANASIIRNPVSANTPTDTINVAKMEFENTVLEFGEVDAGAVIEHTFKFKNTGKVPLIINDARSTCGCTVPKWPKELIQPGKSGVIQVKFDTKNMRKKQRKPVIITANTYPSETKLYLEGFVHGNDE